MQQRVSEPCGPRVFNTQTGHWCVYWCRIDKLYKFYCCPVQHSIHFHTHVLYSNYYICLRQGGVARSCPSPGVFRPLDQPHGAILGKEARCLREASWNNHRIIGNKKGHYIALSRTVFGFIKKMMAHRCKSGLCLVYT